jgi:MFS transporter, NNP family, nitrate/nitrite transporter
MSAPISVKLNLLSFKGNTRILHLSWGAFFVSFLVWFNHAPLMGSIRDALNLTDQEIKTLLILNVALTIPARIVIGMTVDKYGPRIVYSSLLAISGVLCFAFALADDFQSLALVRFLMGFAGAGFVIGIRMISEWFPARQVGLAEGIYGGWGNFGSAAAAMTLPLAAQIFGGADGWRYAVALTGVIAMVYAVIYYRSVSDTPKGSTYFQPKKSGALEVTSKGDFFLYIVMKAPLFLALGLLNWKLGAANLALLPKEVEVGVYAVLTALFLYQVYHIHAVNKHVFTKPVPEIHRYNFKQVAVLDLAYLVTFGSELAVVSMLPLFFLDTFNVSPVLAGLLASAFAFTNLVARPGGGLLSDMFGRKKTLVIFLLGLAFGYLVMSQINSSWPLAVAVIATMLCSIFVQAGNGAVFAMAPLIKRRQTGQIAGMVGAYGSVGAVSFLTVLSFVSPSVFFMTIAGAAIAVVIATAFLLDEPEGHMAEVMPDGTVELIEVT